MSITRERDSAFSNEPVYEYHKGHLPLLVSVPHAGTRLPDNIYNRLVEDGRWMPDTDWHVPILYEFAKALGAHMIVANFNRYVVDLNRSSDGISLYKTERSTGLIPETLFNGTPLYKDKAPVSEQEIEERIKTYWRPYHDKIKAVLAELKSESGYALLYDAHSIASRVPNLFQGTLPDLNLGTANDQSCAPEITRAVSEVIDASGFTSVTNGRFIGGYITRHYGNPQNSVHAIQMEIGQDTYMDMAKFRYNETRAERLIPVLKRVIEAYLDCAEQIAGSD